MAGGTGNDTFICDLFDVLIDFNLNEDDRIIGQCSSLDQTEIKASPANTLQEDFKLPPQSQPPQPKLQSPPLFNHDDIPQEDFGSVPPFPIPPSNEIYFSG